MPPTSDVSVEIVKLETGHLSCDISISPGCVVAFAVTRKQLAEMASYITTWLFDDRHRGPNGENTGK
jgi:hypothetical protein